MTYDFPFSSKKYSLAVGIDRRGGEIAAEAVLPEGRAFDCIEAGGDAAVADHEDSIAEQDRRGARGDRLVEFPSDLAIGHIAAAAGMHGEQLPAAGGRGAIDQAVAEERPGGGVHAAGAKRARVRRRFPDCKQSSPQHWG